MTAITKGDLLGRPFEVIADAWNRNSIPWWLLLPQGIFRAIKRRAGTPPLMTAGARIGKHSMRRVSKDRQ